MKTRVLWRCPLCQSPSVVYLPLVALKVHLVQHHGCPKDEPLSRPKKAA